MSKSIVLLSILFVLVRGMEELTEAMLSAKSLEDLLSIAQERRDKHAETFRLRERHLQDLGLEDSEPILADMFEGEAGFYHGVASGT